jgi:hypothetical protein
MTYPKYSETKWDRPHNDTKTHGQHSKSAVNSSVNKSTPDKTTVCEAQYTIFQILQNSSYQSVPSSKQIRIQKKNMNTLKG